jgi:hypothetical protein
MRGFGAVLFVASLVGCTVGATPQVRAEADDPKLKFVTEYIRELSTQEDIRANGEQELANASTENDQLTSVIHSGTRMQLELQDQIAILKGMNLHFDPKLDPVPIITGTYQRKFDLYQRLIDISSAFLASHKPGVDYDAMVAELPKLRAFLESEDETLFKVAPLVFFIIVDPRADSKNHQNHLVITKDERSELLHQLAAGFGKNLEDKNPNYIVASAMVLNLDLLKEKLKSSDDPWE